MFITNNHVIPDLVTAENSAVEFNKESNLYGKPKSVEQFDFKPSLFFLTNETLDYTIIAIDQNSGAGRPLNDFGFLPLIPKRGKVRISDAVNIIQHPGGQEKSVVVHNSNLLHMENESDLEPYLWGTPVIQSLEVRGHLCSIQDRK